MGFMRESFFRKGNSGKNIEFLIHTSREMVNSLDEFNPTKPLLFVQWQRIGAGRF